MMIAMMLPSAWPVILLYARLVRTAGEGASSRLRSRLRPSPGAISFYGFFSAPLPSCCHSCSSDAFGDDGPRSAELTAGLLDAVAAKALAAALIAGSTALLLAA
jgi:predicted metal-binding membrane protein